MASVRQLPTPRKDGKRPWVCDYTDAGGKRRRITPKSGLKRDADAARLRIEAELAGGTHIAPSSALTVEAVCERYLRHMDEGRLFS